VTIAMRPKKKAWRCPGTFCQGPQLIIVSARWFSSCEGWTKVCEGNEGNEKEKGKRERTHCMAASKVEG
jgi:hypothetical protein